MVETSLTSASIQWLCLLISQLKPFRLLGKTLHDLRTVISPQGPAFLLLFSKLRFPQTHWTACTVVFAVPPLGKLPFLSFISPHSSIFFLTSRRNLPCTSQPPRWGETLLYILTASHSSPVIDYFIPDCDELFLITISKVSNLRWQTRPFVVASNIVAVTL